MLTRLRLKNFKNFQDAELHLGEFTLLVGTNAAGKSNIRDALRFLYGLAAGYSLAEIWGGRYDHSGLKWSGIRGWLSEMAFHGESIFAIEATYDAMNQTSSLSTDGSVAAITYSVTVDTGISPDSTIPQPPKIVSELIKVHGTPNWLIERDDTCVGSGGIRMKFPDRVLELPHQYSNDLSIMPTITQVVGHVNELLPIQALQHSMTAIQDFDFDPALMRNSVLPGHKFISNRGDNLSSVLYSIFQKPHAKESFLDWIQALTPMDATDLEFVLEESGKIAFRIIEASGQKTSIASASDGTLRFLATLAAYFSPIENGLYFLEELENGIHPTRLYLLLQLIGQQSRTRKIQTIATTHSPQLLRLLSEDSLKNASLIYRLDDRLHAQIQPISKIPHIQDVLKTNNDLGNLQESGWFEDTMFFLRDEVLR